MRFLYPEAKENILYRYRLWVGQFDVELIPGKLIMRIAIYSLLCFFPSATSCLVAEIRSHIPGPSSALHTKVDGITTCSFAFSFFVSSGRNWCSKCARFYSTYKG